MQSAFNWGPCLPWSKSKSCLKICYHMPPRLNCLFLILWVSTSSGDTTSHLSPWFADRSPHDIRSPKDKRNTRRLRSFGIAQSVKMHGWLFHVLLIILIIYTIDSQYIMIVCSTISNTIRQLKCCADNEITNILFMGCLCVGMCFKPYPQTSRLLHPSQSIQHNGSFHGMLHMIIVSSHETTFQPHDRVGKL